MSDADIAMITAHATGTNQPGSLRHNNRPPWDVPNVHQAFTIEANAGELLEIGPMRMRLLEAGLHTDNRIGAMTTLIPAGAFGPPLHRHLMFDETFLITRGVLRMSLGNVQKDAKVGDYTIVPAGAWHTFTNTSGETVEFFGTCTPAYYANYFRELARLSAEGRLNPQENVAIMKHYATEVYDLEQHGELTRSQGGGIQTEPT